MPRLPDSLQHWGTDEFAKHLTEELFRLPSAELPLEQGVTPGSHADTSSASLHVLQTWEEGDGYYIKAGVFFTEIVGSCGCGDEPMHLNAYCIVRVYLDKNSAEAVLRVEQA